MKKREYKGFTLVEMVVVMGVLIILMGVGIVGTRAYLDNANATKIRSTVSEIYKASASWKQTHGTYPIPRSTKTRTDSGAQVTALSQLFTQNTLLKSYFPNGLDLGSAPYTFMYMTDTSGNYVLICAALGGNLSSTDVTNVLSKGIYCDGDGFRQSSLVSASFNTKEVPYSAAVGSDFYTIQRKNFTTGPVLKANWNSTTKSF